MSSAERQTESRSRQWVAPLLIAVWASLAWIWNLEGPTGAWRYPLLNSDSLQAAFIARDVFSAPERLAYWTWPDAPRFFPDLLLHVLLWPLAPDLLANTLIPTLVLQATIGWVLYAWWRHGSGRWAGWIAVSLYGAATVLLLSDFVRPFDSPEVLFWWGTAFRSWRHGGTAAVALLLAFSLALDLAATTSPTRRRGAALRRGVSTAVLGVVLGVTSFSDPSLVAYFVVPALASVFLLRWLSGVPAARALRWVGVGLVAVASYLLCRRFYAPRPISAADRLDLLALHLGSARRTLHLLLREDVWGPALLAAGLLSATGIAAVALWRSRRQELSTSDTMWLGFAVFLPAAAWCNLLSGLALGFLHDGHTLRYLPMVFLASVAVPAGGLARWVTRAPRLAARPERAAPWLWGVPTLTLVATLAVIVVQPERWTFHWQPDADTRCVMETLDEGRPRAGLAGYWQARPLAFHSDSELRVTAVDAEGKLFTTVSNLADALPPVGGDEHAWPSFSFAVLDARTRMQARRSYPRPSSRTRCGAYEVWEYEEPHGLFQPLFREAGPVLDYVARLRGEVVLPAAMLAGAGEIRGWSRAGRSRVVAGPGWRHLEGPYELEIETSVCCGGSSGSARWRIDALPSRNLAGGALRPAEAPQTARATVDLDDPSQQLVIRVGGLGVERVTVHWITLRPLSSHRARSERLRATGLSDAGSPPAP